MLTDLEIKDLLIAACPNSTFTFGHFEPCYDSWYLRCATKAESTRIRSFAEHLLFWKHIDVCIERTDTDIIIWAKRSPEERKYDID